MAKLTYRAGVAVHAKLTDLENEKDGCLFIVKGSRACNITRALRHMAGHAQTEQIQLPKDAHEDYGKRGPLGVMFVRPEVIQMFLSKVGDPTHDNVQYFQFKSEVFQTRKEECDV